MFAVQTPSAAACLSPAVSEVVLKLSSLLLPNHFEPAKKDREKKTTKRGEKNSLLQKMCEHEKNETSFTESWICIPNETKFCLALMFGGLAISRISNR